MSSSNTSMIEAINAMKQTTSRFTQIWFSCMFIFGLIGHSLSIYVFTRRQFRSNPCTRYFLASTISGCTVVYLTIPFRLLQIVYNIDIFIHSHAGCRILSYLFNCFRILPSWFIALASIDRFLCSSTNATLRRWSNIRIASRTILITILLNGIIYSHMPFNYTIFVSPRSCAIAGSSYQAFYSIWNLFFFAWVPTICMFIFGLLTIRHVRQGKKRVAAQNTQNTQNNAQRNQKKVDRQLIQMLIIQCLVYGSISTANSVFQLYVSITNTVMIKNDFEKVRDNSVLSVMNATTIFGPCMSFYLFLMSSQLFRSELMNLFRRQPLTPGLSNTFATGRQTHN
ncbi:unnamed protein product [Rotaria sordida]|uniref:G-protein coupled receptors family 1 profile domain-containing protein n=1 Tax=Rotaria sordida TaxID=392033 RepID=A0A814QSL1_9BILA|nr:unnamed protein product [Rotaria sordida]